MAHMYPPEVAAGNPSAAEKRIFSRLRDGLPSDWVVLHSLGLAEHASKPWAEIDFVLVGPLGIYCLEVKGGRVDRHEGVWTFTDRAGRETRKSQGPFEQVGSASAALTKYLESRLPWVLRQPIGYAVVAPDIEFKISGPDVNPKVVYDSVDSAKPIAAFIKRLGEYWTLRLHRSGNSPFSSREIQSVLSILRPDFDLRPSLRMRLGQISDELLILTRQQYEVLDGLEDNERMIVRGAAGTGKTFLAVEEAKRAAAQGMKVLLCCFNRSLAQHLATIVRDAPGITATTLHSWMARVIIDANLQGQIPDAEAPDVHEVFQPLVALDAMELLDSRGEFDLLVVDEAQDLLHEAYVKVFDALVKGGLRMGRWRFFYDPRQNLFDGTDPSGLAELLNINPAQFRLRVNCRNTAPIAVAVGLLSGTLPDETRVVEGPEVDTIWYGDDIEERRLVSKYVRRLIADGMRPADLVILSEKTLAHSCMSDGFVGVPVKLNPGDDFDQDRVRFRTVQSFKGLESDVVLVVDCDKLGDKGSCAALYVAASRARSKLAIFINNAALPDYEVLGRRFGHNLVVGAPHT